MLLNAAQERLGLLNSEGPIPAAYLSSICCATFHTSRQSNAMSRDALLALLGRRSGGTLHQAVIPCSLDLLRGTGRLDSKPGLVHHGIVAADQRRGRVQRRGNLCMTATVGLQTQNMHSCADSAANKRTCGTSPAIGGHIAPRMAGPSGANAEAVYLVLLAFRRHLRHVHQQGAPCDELQPLRGLERHLLWHQLGLTLRYERAPVHLFLQGTGGAQRASASLCACVRERHSVRLQACVRGREWCAGGVHIWPGRRGSA